MFKYPAIRINFTSQTEFTQKERKQIHADLIKLGWKEAEYSDHGSGPNSNLDNRTTAMFSFYWPHDSEPEYPDGIDYEVVR